ncbi:MAG: hypothetical protein V4671_19480 [Armatimonadota bacterium]
MNLLVTSYNRDRAERMGKIIKSGQVFVPVKAPADFPQQQINPWFLAHLRAGSYPSQRLANACALVEKLEDNPDLRRAAAAQHIEVEEIREMIEEAQEYVNDDPYQSAGEGSDDA